MWLEPAAATGFRLLHRLAILTAALTFLGIVVGGVVTSTESGRVDKGWPLCGGKLWPDFSAMAENPGLLVEHGHRLAMIAVGILALLIAILALCGAEKRPLARKLAIALPFLVLPPAILGGLTVKMKLHPAFSILHVSVAMIFLSAVATYAIVTGRRWIEETTRLDGKKLDGLAGIALTTLIFIYVQIVLGAIPRHATADVGGSTMLTIGNMIHIVWAFAVVTMALFLAGRVIGRLSKVQQLLRPAAGLFALILVQVFLGFATFLTQPKVPAPVVDEHKGFVASGSHEALASVHQGVGVLILLTALLLTMRAYRVRYVSGADPVVEPPLQPEEGVAS